MWDIHMVKYYSTMRKENTLPFATRMKLEYVMLRGISLTEKDKYCIVSLICGTNKVDPVKNRGQNGGYWGLGMGNKSDGI